MLIQLEITLTENLSSLARRMIGTDNIFKSTPKLQEDINDYLDKIATIIQHISTIISLLDKKQAVIITDEIPTLANTLQLNLESAITDAFAMSDNNALNYHELIHYLGILYALQKANLSILHYLADTKCHPSY